MNLYNRQKKMNIKNDKVVCVIGCGGIGFNVCLLLAMSGIKKLYIFDHDIFEEHNLNRIPVPIECVGMKKVEACSAIIKQMRPDLDVLYFKTKFDEILIEEKLDHVVDCTDSYKTQLKVEEFSKENEIPYCKVGYDGERISIHNKVATWSTDLDDDNVGYTVVPSWSVPAMIAASMAVAKVLKYEDKEMSTEIKHLFIDS